MKARSVPSSTHETQLSFIVTFTVSRPLRVNVADALELAAARIKLLPPQAILARLGRRLELLRGGARDMPDRHQTLRHTIAWSYDLLEAGEQTLQVKAAPKGAAAMSLEWVKLTPVL